MGPINFLSVRPFGTTYIERYHELLIMFCYVCFPFSSMLWSDMFLCGVNKNLFDVSWLDDFCEVTMNYNDLWWQSHIIDVLCESRRRFFMVTTVPDIKVHGANMGPIWGRHDPGGPHVGPMNFPIWGNSQFDICLPVMHRLVQLGLSVCWRALRHGIIPPPTTITATKWL